MRSILLLAQIICGISSYGQDLTGIWRGQFRQQDRVLQLMDMENRYRFEVQLDQRGKAFNGVTYSYKTTEFYGKATAKGTIHTGTKKVYLEELKIVDVRMRSGSDACVMTCFLQYSRNGKEEFLEGTYVSMNTSDSTDCGRGTVFLRRVQESDFFKEPFLVKREAEKRKEALAKAARPKPGPLAKNDTGKQQIKPVPPPIKPPRKPSVTTTPEKPAAPPEPRDVQASTVPSNLEREPNKPKAPLVIPPVLKNRENELVKTFSINTREITVSLYDNGTIDKDTVSVYLNKKQVVNRQMLSLNPITLTIELDEDNDYHELVMVAENLGEIPPNTSLMVVKAGNKQYEVRITSTEQKNAVVIFKFEKEK